MWMPRNGRPEPAGCCGAGFWWDIPDSFRSSGVSGRTLRRPEPFEQRPALAVIGDDRVRADRNQPVALPRVGAAAAAGFVTGDADRRASGPFHIVDLDVAVSKAEKQISLDIVLGEEAVDHHLFREGAYVVLRAVD